MSPVEKLKAYETQVMAMKAERDAALAKSAASQAVVDELSAEIDKALAALGNA